MSIESGANNVEKKEILDDNARKFTLRTISPDFLEKYGASSFVLATDWIETGENNEKKIAHKKFENGEVQILLIEKVTKDGNRKSQKEEITEEKYRELLTSSILHVEKKRYEFAYDQESTIFSMKYDEFFDSGLRVLEVDAMSEQERNSFNPGDFLYELAEVTGDARYYGYRVASVV